MNDGISLGIYLGAGVVFAVICMVIAMSKGQPAWVGLLLGFFFNCLGLVALLIMKKAADAPTGIAPPHPGSQWLADPTGRHQYRLWDGQRWSGHVSDSGRAGYDPIP